MPEADIVLNLRSVSWPTRIRRSLNSAATHHRRIRQEVCAIATNLELAGVFGVPFFKGSLQLSNLLRMFLGHVVAFARVLRDIE